jgi:hypothetical protein
MEAAYLGEAEIDPSHLTRSMRSAHISPVSRTPHPQFRSGGAGLLSKLESVVVVTEVAIIKLTLSVIKADIGSVGGPICPSKRLLEAVHGRVQDQGRGLLIDSYVSYTGDEIAILMTHTRGSADPEIHQLAWEAFLGGTGVAKAQGLCGAGQDLLKDAFSGNVRGMGAAVAEMAFDERGS